MIDELAPAAALLATTPDRMRALFTALPPDLLRRRPREGEWSALQTLEHMAETESEVFTRRINAFLAGEASFPNYEPDPAGDADPAALLDALESARRHNLELVGRVSAADLDRRARHAQLGEVSLRTQLLEWAAHDLNHVIQAERAVMQPFIAGSGPWRPSFAEHDQSAE